MRIVGIGVDITDINKMRGILSKKTGKRFVENTFTDNEIACAGKNVSKFATAFAAKEAAYKAFGTGWIEGKDVELLRDRHGIPCLKLHGEIEKIAKKRKVKETHVSVSWIDCCAVAVVVLTS